MVFIYYLSYRFYPNKFIIFSMDSATGFVPSTTQSAEGNTFFGV